MVLGIIFCLSALMCVAVAVLCAAFVYEVWDYLLFLWLHRAVDIHLWGLAVYSGCRMDCSAAVRVEKLNNDPW